MNSAKLNKITQTLKESYPDAICGLNFKTPYEILVATVLSAQCTDARVNEVTSVLFKMANTPEGMLALGYDKIFATIKSCGLAKAKTQHILSLSKRLMEEFNSLVPDNIESLMSLDGVGRKTANVVLANAFGKAAIAVDTHVFRVANRIGYALEKDPLKTEKALMKAIDEKDWSKMHHVLIWHGRKICHARKPECSLCPIKELCEYNEKNL